MKFLYRTLILIGFAVIIISSCKQKSQKEVVKENIIEEKKEVPVSFNFHRYEMALFSLNPNKLSSELGQLIPEYRFFLGDQWSDAAKQRTLYNYLIDKDIKEIYNEVKSLHPDLSSTEKELTAHFTILKAKYPEINVPKVFTYVSGLDIDMPVIYADTVIAIAIDDFLGPENKVYKKAGIPRYKAARCSRNNLIPSVMYAVAGGLMQIDQSKLTLLDIMISEGKALYVTDITLPETPDYLKIGYTEDQLNWCNANEGNIWALLIENKLLYSADREKTGKFFLDGPNTQGLSEQSPGRIASYMGWQIVKKYMENQKDVTIKQLFENTDSQEILSKSGYKPKK